MQSLVAMDTTLMATAFVLSSAVDAETDEVATVVVTEIVVIVVIAVIVVVIVTEAVNAALQPICVTASSESACRDCLARFHGKT